MRNIAIRVDASDQIGTGHFMRCLTLADALKKRGARVRFISRHMPDHLRGMLPERAHEFTRLTSGPSESNSDGLHHARWLGTSQQADAQDAIHALSDRTWDWLVVDHYALDARWESVLRKLTKHILIIDDIADRQHDCDLLLDQNFYADMTTRYTGKVPPNCRLLLGPCYAMLREEFRHMRDHVKPRSGPVRRILVFFGGVDADNNTRRALEALSIIGIPDVHVDVIIGSQHPHRKAIETECAQHGFACFVQTNRMAALMVEADLAIGACGAATWERCAVGLPTIVLVVADHQRNSAADLDAIGVIVNLGDANQVTTEELANNVAALMADGEKRSKLSLLSLELVAPSKRKGVVELLFDASDRQHSKHMVGL